MYPMTAQTIKEALTLIFQGIERLHEAFPSRAFTIDGRLVGDIGEVIAELEYDLTLDEVSVRDHDAQMRNGRRVQIKATFKDSLTFTTCLTTTIALRWLDAVLMLSQTVSGA